MVERHVLTGSGGERLTLEIRKTLWLRAYLAILGAMCFLTATPPDVAKLKAAIECGMQMRLVTANGATRFIGARWFLRARDWFQA